MYDDQDDWDGDSHRFNTDVHYRLYLSPLNNTPTIICVQDFDYLGYDARRILSPNAWAKESEAEDALLDLLPEIERIEERLTSVTLDFDMQARLFARAMRKKIEK